MIECYKYLTRIYRVDADFFYVDNDCITRGHSLKLRKPMSTNGTRHHFFANRCINVWNSLTEDIISVPDINPFKNELDKHWAKFMYRTDLEWYNNPKLDHG